MSSLIRRFSLIELVAVLGVIAVMAVIFIPYLSSTDIKAKEDVRAREMRSIQKAFGRLENDCVLTDSDLQDIADYGLWPLVSREHPYLGDEYDYEEYDYEKCKGWRGPYIERESEASISNTEGQPSGTITVPVINDPYGGYYRVIIPNGESSRKIALVCTGENGVLETSSSDWNGDKFDEDLIGDDAVLMLLPCGS